MPRSTGGSRLSMDRHVTRRIVHGISANAYGQQLVDVVIADSARAGG